MRRELPMARRGVVGLTMLLAVAGCESTGGAGTVAPSPVDPGVTTPPPATSPAPGNQDPKRFAEQVRKHARAAGIAPELVMAILYNESYKPHDPELERAWAKLDPNPSFGVANMHKPAFDEAKRTRDFAGRSWDELPDDPDLAIEAAAWHLHDLAAQLPAKWPGTYTRDELIALGYNAGAGSMKAFAKGSKPGRLAQAYLDRLRSNWEKAKQAVS
jgi:Transglycosylase SLT domain